jgi:hypothetical protein
MIGRPLRLCSYWGSKLSLLWPARAMTRLREFRAARLFKMIARCSTASMERPTAASQIGIGARTELPGPVGSITEYFVTGISNHCHSPAGEEGELPPTVDR